MTVKTSISGAVNDTLTEQVRGDHYGGQIIDVQFYNDAELTTQVTPTAGTYTLEWSTNGRDWLFFDGAPIPVNASSEGVGDWEAPGYVGYVRFVAQNITGATHWKVSYRANKFGFPGIRESLVTSRDNPNVARLAVDSQQTSFEQNHQFRFFDTWLDISNTNQIVYYIQTPNPINIFLREIELYNGGRAYRAYNDDGSHTFTGTLSSQGVITPINYNLNDSRLDALPSTLVTVQRAVGSAIFTAGNPPYTGTSIKTDGNSNRNVTGYQTSGVRFGTDTNFAAYLVFDGIAPNNATSGSFEIVYEERFNG